MTSHYRVYLFLDHHIASKSFSNLPHYQAGLLPMRHQSLPFSQKKGTVLLLAIIITGNKSVPFSALTGKVIGRITQRHRAKEFLAFLQQIDRSTPSELDLHVILDNSSTHKTPAIKQWLEKHPRFKLHFTPTSASWLNAVEGWFAQLERRALYRGVFTSVADLKTAIRHFIEAHNELSAKPFKWNKTAESIISSVHKAKLGAMKNRLLN